MNSFRADLHTHSTYSDGTCSVEELFLLAEKNKLSGLAITDHDTVDALPEAMKWSKKLQIQTISGVEFSTIHNNVSIHLLGYSFHPEAPSILNLCRKSQQFRYDRNNEIIDRLKRAGMPISDDEWLQAGIGASTLGRPHIAGAMVKKGYVSTVEEAFKKHLGTGKRCYSPGEKATVEETIEAIHQANGFAVIAHPHLIKHRSVIRDLLTMPFDGIECYYARMDPSRESPWIQTALDKNWLMTGGSDFHGTIKPQSIGCSWVNEDAFAPLIARFEQNLKAY